MLYTTKSLWFLVLSKTNPKADKEQMLLTVQRKSNCSVDTSFTYWTAEVEKPWTVDLVVKLLPEAKGVALEPHLSTHTHRQQGQQLRQEQQSPLQQRLPRLPQPACWQVFHYLNGIQEKVFIYTRMPSTKLGEMEKHRNKWILSHALNLSLICWNEQEAASMININCYVKNTQEFQDSPQRLVPRTLASYY